MAGGRVEGTLGQPDRLLQLDAKTAAVLNARRLTQPYNQRPAWLDHPHNAREAVVAGAYGWGGLAGGHGAG
jgi:hypothetical protein